VTVGPQTGDVFVHGTVSRNRKPVEGAEVLVNLSPEEEMAEAKEGERIKLWSTKPVATDESGRWVVRIDPDTVPSKYFPASQDYLNFELMVSQGAEFTTWGSTLWLLKDTRVWRTENSRPGDAVMDIALDLGKEKIAITDSSGEVERSSMPVRKPTG